MFISYTGTMVVKREKSREMFVPPFFFFGVGSPSTNIGEPRDANALSPANIHLQAKVGHLDHNASSPK